MRNGRTCSSHYQLKPVSSWQSTDCVHCHLLITELNSKWCFRAWKSERNRPKMEWAKAEHGAECPGVGAEWRVGVTEIHLSTEQLLHHLRSAHMGSMRRGQRTFRPGSKQECRTWHGCIFEWIAMWRWYTTFS